MGPVAVGAIDQGTDVDTRFGVPLRWGLVSGRANVSNALARRFVAARGSLSDDPEYGLDLRAYLNAALTAAGLSQLRSAVVAQAELEPRIQSCETVTFVFSQQASSLTVTLGLTDAAGPFTLVIGIDALTVAILNAGQTTAPVVAAAPAPDVGTGSNGLDGGPGPSGPPGPAGTSSTGSLELSFFDIVASSLGSAEIIQQITVDFSGLPGSTLVVDLVGRALSGAGTGTLRIYVGGSYDVIDGTLVGTVTFTNGSYAEVQISGSITNPTGLRPIKIVAISSGAGVDARLRDFTVSIR